MPYVRLYAISSPPPSHPRTSDPVAARNQLDAFVVTVKNAVSAAGVPKPAAANSVVVEPGGTTFSTIGAALDSITDASLRKQYVVSIGAGTYDEVVTCKPWIFLTGAGQGQTIITHTSQPDPALAGTVRAASNSAVQNCTVRATTTGTTVDAVMAVNCQGAVDFDIENCELIALDETNQTNVTAIAMDYWTEANGSHVNISYTRVTAKGGWGAPLALSTGFYSYVHGMESRFIAEGGLHGDQAWGCAAIDQSIILVENCSVQGAQYSLWQDDTGRITANQCQLVGAVGPGVVVNN